MRYLSGFCAMHCPNCGNEHYTPTPYFYLWEGKEFTLQKCRQCGLIALHPQPTDAELARLYADEYFQSGQHGLNALQATYEEGQDRVGEEKRRQAIHDNVLQFKPDTRSYFEIGFAMGHMLAAARSMGMEIGGIEFSEMAVRKAADKFGIQALCGNFEQVDLKEHIGRWDCVYGGDVFEHFLHPDKVVENMHAILADKGIAVVAVPSTFNLFSTYLATAFYRLLGKRKKFYDKPYHVFEYTPRTISALFAQRFSKVVVVNRIKKPGQLNMKGGGWEYRMKYLVHCVNYPFTRLFGRNGDRLLVVAFK